MAKFKQSPGPEANYTMIHNDFARSQLTPKAKAVYLLLRSHRSGWAMTTARIGEEIDLSRNTVAKAVGELEEAGYLRREQQRNDSGLFSEVEYLVLASPDRAQNLTVAQNTGNRNLSTTAAQKTGNRNLSTIRRLTSNKTNQEDQTPLTPQGGRGTAAGNDPEAFTEFWESYPRKVGKQKARVKFAAAVKRAGASDLVIAGAKRLAADPNLPERRFIPHPTTWLERDGWEDEPLPQRDRGTAGRTLGTRPEDWDWPEESPSLEILDAEIVGWGELSP